MIVLVPLLFLGPYAMTLAGKYGSSEELINSLQADPTAIALQIGAVIPAHLLTLLAGWVLVTKGRKYEFLETLGWKDGGVRWWHYVAFLVGFFALGALLGRFVPEQETELIRILQSSTTALVLVAIMATFTAPLVEEVVYRGILYSPLKRATGVVGAVIIVTILFALVHVPQYYESTYTLIMVTALSLGLTLVRAFSKNLLPAFILHTLFNGVQSLFLILQPFMGDAPPPAVQPVHGLVVGFRSLFS